MLDNSVINNTEREMSIQATAQVQLTPAMMAEAFWSMEDSQQAEFFDELARVIKEDHKTNSSAYALGELQWFYLADRMSGDKFKEPRAMLMAMAAPLYLNTLRVAGC